MAASARLTTVATRKPGKVGARKKTEKKKAPTS